MSSLPPELDFSTALGREATPERMNAAMVYIMGRIAALEALKLDVDAALNQLKALGLERLDGVLTPIFTSAAEMQESITVAADAVEAVRAGVIDDVRDAVVAKIAEEQLYIKAGEGAKDATLYGSDGIPDNALGVDGDLCVAGA